MPVFRHSPSRTTSWPCPGISRLVMVLVAPIAIMTGNEPNRLIHEKSPYLRQHAHNPVDWYPWGEEAFARARTENKPIFLSIGYSTCHWCHVMEEESFENEAIAAQMNEDFVCIKVDREERPDLDHLYLTFVQASTGNGGWPLSVWLTPQLKPFFGGVYFPPEDRGRQPGFPSVLRHLSDLWAENSERIRQQSDQMLQALATDLTPSTAAELPWDDLRTAALDGLATRFDETYAGFDVRQKFPTGPTLDFLLDEAGINPDPGQRQHALDMVEATLLAIATQGLRDHVGGGFHRYTVDQAWRVPHFEKMLYDQAQIASAMLSAWQLTGRPQFRDAVESTLAYVGAELTHPDGGFYSAEDADSLPTKEATRKIEGAFYVWTAAELAEVVPADDLELFRYAFGVRDQGNVGSAHDIQGELVRQNVLHRAHTDGQCTRKFGGSETDIAARLSAALASLKVVRDQRPPPHRDDKVVTAWNGLMISAYARAGQVFASPEHAATARRAAEFLETHLYDAATGLLSRSYREGQRDDQGFAEDYASVIQGLIDLYEVDLDTHWLDWALRLQAKQDELFWDEAQGGYFASNAADASIVLRTKIAHDGAEPAATSVAVRNLGRLAALFHDSTRLAQAEAAALSLASSVERNPLALPQMLAATGWLKGTAQQALIHGEPDDAGTAELLAEVYGRFHPRRVIVRIDSTSRDFIAPRMPLVGGLPAGAAETATAYICENFVCQMPTSDRTELAALLDRQAP